MNFVQALKLVEARLELVHDWKEVSDGTPIKNDVPAVMAGLILYLFRQLHTKGEDPMFHWDHNLFFGRRQDGSVRVLLLSKPPQFWPLADMPSETPENSIMDVTIPAAQWASIMATVTKGGEPANYCRAVDLHES